MTAPIETVNLQGAMHILGKSRPTIMEYIKRGMPYVTRGGKGQQWQFSESAIIKWKAELESGSIDGDKGSYEAGRARKVTAEAAIKEILLAKARGEVVSIALVEARWATIFNNVKTRMLAITPRVAPLIPALGGNIVEIETLLNREIKSVLRALAESAHTPHDEVRDDDDTSS